MTALNAIMAMLFVAVLVALFLLFAAALWLDGSSQEYDEGEGE